MQILRWTGGIVVVMLLAVILALGSMRAGWWNPSYAEVAASQATAPSRFIKLGDVTLHMRDEGTGPTLLMLHSSMTNLREWDDWADRLKTRYRVVRIDWPPYGLSRDPDPSTGMDGVVALIQRFVDQEKLGKFTLIGSSSGSTIAVLYAAAHPERVTALALSTLPLRAPPATRFSRLEQTMIWLHGALVPNYYPKFYYRTVLASLYGVPSRLTPQTVEWYYETNNIPGGFARVGAYYAADKRTVWSKGAVAQATQITVPVLLQWGDRDPVLGASLANKAVAQFAHAHVTLIHYPDVGHYPMLELPGPTERDLETFLDRVTATPQPRP